MNINLYRESSQVNQIAGHVLYAAIQYGRFGPKVFNARIAEYWKHDFRGHSEWGGIRRNFFDMPHQLPELLDSMQTAIENGYEITINPPLTGPRLDSVRELTTHISDRLQNFERLWPGTYPIELLRTIAHWEGLAESSAAQPEPEPLVDRFLADQGICRYPQGIVYWDKINNFKPDNF